MKNTSNHRPSILTTFLVALAASFCVTTSWSVVDGLQHPLSSKVSSTVSSNARSTE